MTWADRRARLAAPALALALATLAGCAAPREGAPLAVPPAPGRGDALDRSLAAGREVLLRFARAVEGGRWAEAWPLLSERWRGATSPGRLAADYRSAGPVAREAAERVVALLEAGAPLAGDAGQPTDDGAGQGLSLSVGPGRAARLVAEAGGWRVDALE